ncbi:Myb-binding protein 1A [Saguinus oedipus]|uniref:Myb-binding protein 1A n=1 Tax=Saguinus oedipus TaxID=9490 RepID=A0ABQ9V8X6_SAGOE|nr:Myb-binding protein 1A [Saguinus oedipus]
MLQTLNELEAPSSEPRAATFQHLLLLMGIYLFKSPTESCDLLGDIQTCIRKSLGERHHGSHTKAIDPQELPCVEVVVEILLALLTQPSHFMHRVAQIVLGHVCSHLTPCSLQLILDVLNPETSEDEDDHVVVMDKSDEQWLKAAEVLPAWARWGGRSGKIAEVCDEPATTPQDKSEDSKESRGSESEEGGVRRDMVLGFWVQLMSVLQAGKALGGEESEDEEELGDEAMMALDQSLTSLSAEQKLWIQARQDEKSKPQKEKALRCDFQIWPENILVLELLEPLLGIIPCSLHRSNSKQEQDLLHKMACIFTHHLFHGHHCCHKLGDCVEALRGQVVRLVEQAGRQPDSTTLYHFNASLYLLQVLKGNKGCMLDTQEELEAGTDSSHMTKGLQAASCLDLNLTMCLYSSALSSFLTKHHSPLTVPMFLSLFSQQPVSVRAHPAHLGSPLSPSPIYASQHSLPRQVLCKSLLPVLV